MSAPFKARIRRDDPTRELWRIAETGETGQVEQLLARGAEINDTNGEGVTPLMIAAYHGHVEMVRTLTDHGANLQATDNDGFTAAMLADHSGHHEIVRILLARGAKKIPRASAYASTDPFASDETFDTLGDCDAPAPDNPSVKTLHEPPDIWDVVHETHTEFNPRSAFFGHFTSVHSLVLGLVALIAGGGAVFAFLKYRGASENPPAAPTVQLEKRNVETGQTSRTAATKNVASSAEGQRSSQNADSGTTETVALPPATVAAMPASLAAPLEPGVAATVPPKPDKRVTAKRRQQTAAKSLASGTATLAVTDKTNVKDEGQTSTTAAAKSDNAPAKSDTDKRIEPNGVKKEEAKKEADKAPSPQAAVPVKASPTPKPKVINWP